MEVEEDALSDEEEEDALDMLREGRRPGEAEAIPVGDELRREERPAGDWMKEAEVVLRKPCLEGWMTLFERSGSGARGGTRTRSLSLSRLASTTISAKFSLDQA